MKNCKYFASCGNEENCKDCKGFEPVKKVVYFKGAKSCRVLIDGNYYKSFYAKTVNQAIEKFLNQED